VNATVAGALAAAVNVPVEDIQTDGKGFDEPKHQGDTPEVHRLNRRAEVCAQAAGHAPSNQVVGGSTTRRRAGLDVAASAAAVRSEAEDERRSREQSVRARFQYFVRSAT
jgi:hypothetical protein